MKRGVIFALKM